MYQREQSPPLLELDWIAFDVETTGLDPDRDGILELGAVRFDPRRRGKVLDSFSALTDPGCRIMPASTKIHGITPAQLVNHGPLIDALKSILEWVEQFPHPILVAHNAPYDRDFFYRALYDAGLGIPQWRWVDTLQIARKRFPKIPSRTLRALVRFLGYDDKADAEPYHRGPVDAEFCGQIASTFLMDPRITGLQDIAALSALWSPNVSEVRQ
jgi:DNA polymerase III epsilon subunit-like protein